MVLARAPRPKPYLGLLKLAAAVALLAAALAVAPAAQAVGTLDQKQEDTTDCATVIGSTVTGAQSFTAGLSGNLDQIDVFFAFLNANPPALTVQIQNVTSAMGGDIPGGTVLGTATVATPVAGWNSVVFSPTVAVVAGTKYAIVLSASAEVGSWMGSVFQTNAYPAGNGSHNVGSGWAVNPGTCDQAFRTYVAPAVAVTLESASAVRTAKGVVVRWRTASEVDVLGFNVYRERNGRRLRVNLRLIAAHNRASGASYSYLDRSARKGTRYWIQAVNVDGSRSWYGPARVARP